MKDKLIASAQWNTGREYTPEGQIIRADAHRLEDKTIRVRFVDETRGIEGVYIVERALDYEGFKATVMRLYDNGGYLDLEFGERDQVGRREVTA